MHSAKSLLANLGCSIWSASSIAQNSMVPFPYTDQCWAGVWFWNNHQWNSNWNWYKIGTRLVLPEVPYKAGIASGYTSLLGWSLLPVLILRLIPDAKYTKPTLVQTTWYAQRYERDHEKNTSILGLTATPSTFVVVTMTRFLCNFLSGPTQWQRKTLNTKHLWHGLRPKDQGF